MRIPRPEPGRNERRDGVGTAMGRRLGWVVWINGLEPNGGPNFYGAIWQKKVATGCIGHGGLGKVYGFADLEDV